MKIQDMVLHCVEGNNFLDSKLLDPQNNWLDNVQKLEFSVEVGEGWITTIEVFEFVHHVDKVEAVKDTFEFVLSPLFDGKTIRLKDNLNRDWSEDCLSVTLHCRGGKRKAQLRFEGLPKIVCGVKV